MKTYCHWCNSEPHGKRKKCKRVFCVMHSGTDGEYPSKTMCKECDAPYQPDDRCCGNCAHYDIDGCPPDIGVCTAGETPEYMHPIEGTDCKAFKPIEEATP